MQKEVVHKGASYIERVLDPLRATIYERVSELVCTAWVTDEPVPFSARMEGVRKDLAIGDRWGAQLFECAWFRFAGRIPEGVRGAFVARIDINGELCIVDDEGCPVRGLTNKASTFEPTLGKPGKRVFHLSSETVQSGRLELWGDAGLNDLFGVVQNEGRVEMAEIAVCHEEVRALYYDVEVLVDWLDVLEPQSALAGEIQAALDEIGPVIEGGIEDQSALRLRGKLFPFFNGANHHPLMVSAIGHAHLDLAWLWPIRETIRKGARTLATALYNIERYPDYIFGVSQPQLLVWMEEYYPALYEKIRSAVRAGRIEVQGAMWVETDCNITGGESLVRQLLHGIRFFRNEFGVTVTNLWLPDVFGYCGQLPQIMRKSGVDYFMTQKLSWNTINRFPHHSFSWKGIDGSCVLTHMLPEENYSSPATPRSLHKIDSNYAQKAVSNHALIAFGIGDGGGGPGAEHLERLERVKNLEGLPHVRLCQADEFFKEWEKDSAGFPEWEGELYLEKHQGTLTTQGKTKRFNRKCETALRELEWVSVWAEQCADMPYPAEALDAIWKEVLLYQFHDILPGSSIARVYDESNARYMILLDQIESLAAQRFGALAAQCSGTESVVAFNALPWARSEWVQYDGRWLNVDAPSMGIGRVQMLDHDAFHELAAEENSIENEQLRVFFSNDGTISSIYDKINHREVATQACNQLKVYEDNGDAWDFPSDYREHSAGRVSYVSGSACLDGPCAVMVQSYRYGKSWISQKIILKAGSPMVEFDTSVDWHEEHKMLRVGFWVAVWAENASFEIQYGSIRRPTHGKTSWDRAKDEVPAQQWVDLSDDSYGVSLINDCKYGHRIKDNCIELTLIRSVPHPAAAKILADDTEAESGSSMTDIGRHHFRYAFYPHRGDHVAAGTLMQARIFNHPLRLVDCTESNSVVRDGRFMSVDHPQIDVTALKKAEDGRGWIVRLCCMTDHACSATLRTWLPVSTVIETNLVETDIGAMPLEDGVVELAFTPFEIKTLRLR